MTDKIETTNGFLNYIDPLEGMTFPTALEFLLSGQKLTRQEWNDSATYIQFTDDNHLRIHKSDTGMFHDLIVQRGDLEAYDWVVV